MISNNRANLPQPAKLVIPEDQPEKSTFLDCSTFTTCHGQPAASRTASLLVPKKVSKSGNRRASQIALAQALRNCWLPEIFTLTETPLAAGRHFSGGFAPKEAHPGTSNFLWLREGASATRSARDGSQLSGHL